MSSVLHRFPQEILTEVARYSAVATEGGIPIQAPFNLSCVDRTLHSRLALVSVFRPQAIPLTAGNDLNPAALTHPLLWANIFKDNFSHSAVSRRSFSPSLEGYVLQLLLYCRVLRWLKSFRLDDLTFEDHPSSMQNAFLEIIFLMLIECDGKNTCQLEWAGAYEYCKRWLLVKLYPADWQTGKLVNSWPRDDRCVAYALWNTWLLTTHDRLAAETSVHSVYFQDLLFKFVFCSWGYPHAYAPLSRYNLPLDSLGGATGSSAVPAVIPAHHSVVSALPYPLYRSYQSRSTVLNTKPSSIRYFGTKLSWSPPLLTSAAKLLFNCRADSVPRASSHLPVNREIYFQELHQRIVERTAANPTLAALYDLVAQQGVAAFDKMVDESSFPPHITMLPGLQQAISEVRDITGLYGINPSEAVQLTQEDVEEANSHRETALPFRGGWAEDGQDPCNRRWTKFDPRHSRQKPPTRRMDQLGLPYRCIKASMTHDSFFWRLRMCGDPTDRHRRNIFDFLTPQALTRLGMGHNLRDRWNRLTPGRPWTPGLLDGLFQGAFWYTDERWLLESYQTQDFMVPDIDVGKNFQQALGFPRFHFVGRLQEHHLKGNNRAVPITCDTRTFPRNVLHPGQPPAPIIPFGRSIDPGEDLLIDEGGMNAWLPANFRYSNDVVDGKRVAQFGWGSQGVPSPDRVTTYETFAPGLESAHDQSTCPDCLDQVAYHNHAEELFHHFGMSQHRGDPAAGSHSPLKTAPCDGIADIIITGETDLNHGQAWYHYNYLGRLRKWDGLVCILRIPKHIHARLPTMLFYGYFESDLNFVGSWRLVAGDRLVHQHGLSVPTAYFPERGLNGFGLLGHGGAGVLGDGMRVVQEGPFTMSKVFEDD